MSKAHINSRLAIKNMIVSTEESTILLDHCCCSELVATNGQYRIDYNIGGAYATGISPDNINVISSPLGTAYELNSGKGVAYMLLAQPRNIFIWFKFLSTDNVTERCIVSLYDSNTNYLKAYCDKGTITLKVHDGTQAYTATIPSGTFNPLDSSWHSIGIQINSPYIKTDDLDSRSGYVCRMIIDGEYTEQTVDGGSQNPSSSEFVLPSLLTLGYDNIGTTGNVGVCELRVDMVEYSIEEITSWHLYAKSFYDPYDYNSYVY